MPLLFKIWKIKYNEIFQKCRKNPHNIHSPKSYHYPESTIINIFLYSDYFHFRVFFFSLKIKCNIQLKASSIFFFSLSKDSDSSEAVNRQLLEQLLPNRASFPSITSPSHTHQLLFLHSFSVSFIPKLVSTMLS